MENECECLFCQRVDLNVYEINNNSLLIESSLVDFQEIIYEIFLTKADENVVNYICEECKDLMLQFYIFKQSAKHNLLPSILTRLKDFIEAAGGKPEPVVLCSDNRFTVTYESEIAENEEQIHEQIVYFKEDEREAAFSIKEDTEEMAAGTEDESDHYFEIETINEEAETCLTDQEYETPLKKVKREPVNDSYEVPVIKSNREPNGEESSKVYRCDCGVQSLSLSQVRSHMRHHKKMNCCGVIFKDLKCFEQHERAHENFEAIAPHLPSHACYTCRIIYSTEEDLLMHMASHQDENEIVENVLLERRSAYEDQMVAPFEKSQEDQEGLDDGDCYACGHCGKKQPENEMKIHLLFLHTHLVFCPLDNRCFEGTKQVRLFSEHIRNKHPELFDKSLLYSCRHCNASFTSNFEKLAHMKKCEGKQFACKEHCNKRFATEWLLKNHMRMVMGEERFSCETCGKRCVSRSDLQIHCRSHTNERPYKCPICDKSFKTSANRSSHMDIHEAEKRHECEVCGEKFQTRPILRKHKKKHDEKYQIECICRLCDRKYLSKPHLLRHMKSSHSAPADLTTDGISSFFEEQLEALGH